MGRDKAWIEFEGQPLIRRQIALLRAVGAREVWVSGREDVDYGSLGCRVLQDRFRDAGPLAGIERGLAAAEADWLWVLAVDLPRMTEAFLRRLTPAGSPAQGLVPRIGGQIEPLAASYPTSAHALAEAALRRGDASVQEFAATCERAGRVRFIDVAESDASVFHNCNTPEDLDG